MAFIVSLAVTAALVSPVFLLARWQGTPQPLPVRVRANRAFRR